MDDITRRRFLSYLGTAGAATAFPGLLPFDLANAAPLAPGQTVLVSLFLGGGLDGAHMLVPTDAVHYGHYVDRRQHLAVDAMTTLSLGGENSLHPSLPLLHARYLAGDVAFVRGVDLLGSTGFDALSHFNKTDHVMMGRTAPAGVPSGVWGRWADAEPDNDLLLSTVNFGLPVLYRGDSKRQATSLPATMKDALGADTASDPSELLLVAALDDIAASYSAGDASLEAEFARSAVRGTEIANDLAAVYPGDGIGQSKLGRSLEVMASLVNANLTGTRVYGTVHGSYDTHENQLYDLEQSLLPDLDASLDAFFNALANPQDVVVMIWTEFGRRPQANGSGTDHGTAGNVVLVGPRVNGGLYGQQPSFDLAALDANANLVGSTQFGSVYGELIDGFLGGDSSRVLSQAYPALGLL